MSPVAPPYAATPSLGVAEQHRLRQMAGKNDGCGKFSIQLCAQRSQARRIVLGSLTRKKFEERCPPACRKGSKHSVKIAKYPGGFQAPGVRKLFSCVSP